MRLVSFLLVSVALLVGCSGDDEAAGLAPEVKAEVCAGLDGWTYQRLPERDLSADPGIEVAEAEMDAALDTLAEEGEGEIAADAATFRQVLAAADAADADAAPDPEEGAAAEVRVLEWSRTECAGDDLVWACASPNATANLDLDAPLSATADDAIEATPVEGTGEMVEVSRTEDEVRTAWVDDGEVTEALTVAAVTGGWSATRLFRCDD